MTLIDEEFRWWVDPEGYEIRKGRPASTDPDASLLAQIAGEDTVEPRSTPGPYSVTTRGFYAKFANIERPEEWAGELPKLRSFCNEHGVPTDRARPAFVKDILKKAQLFRQLRDTLPKNTLPIGMSQIDARFAITLFKDTKNLNFNDKKNLKPRIDSASLADFMIYQAIRNYKKGVAFLICDRCGGYFLGGPGEIAA
jgi:hypothetical protein